jgi:hypothetical protein
MIDACACVRREAHACVRACDVVSGRVRVCVRVCAGVRMKCVRERYEM